MPRCCSNIFLNQFTQQPPDVIVDPPGASLCYHYEDIDLPGAWDTFTSIVINKVTIDGVDTVINKEVITPGDWGYDLFSSFSYQQVVTDLTAAAATAGVLGMGFFIALTDHDTQGMRFSIIADALTTHTLTYTIDNGSGPQEFTVDLTGQNCELSYQCFEATYTPENPFLIDYGVINAISNSGLTLIETPFYGAPCVEFEDVPGYIDQFLPYLQTIHGTQAGATITINGNTATVRVLNTLLVPIHMDNAADSGCMPPNSLPSVNNFTLIDCP